MHTFVRSIHRYRGPLYGLLAPRVVVIGLIRGEPTSDDALLEIAPIVVESGHERVSWAVGEASARDLGPSLGLWCGVIPRSIYRPGGAL